MSSVTERGGRFTVRIRRKGKPLVCQTFSKRSDALIWARQAEADMESGRWVYEADKVPSLSAAVMEHLRVIGSRQRQGEGSYALRWHELAGLEFASKTIDAVTPRDIAQWRDALVQRGLASSTTMRKLSLLGSIFGWAIRERGWLTANPLARVTKPRVNDGRERTFTAQEVDMLQRAAALCPHATWWPLALDVLLSSAMRRSELFGLRVGDVAQSTAFVLQTKAGGSRLVPLAPVAVRALVALEVAAKAAKRERLLPITEPESISDQWRAGVARARRLYEADCLARGETPDPGFLANARLHDARHHSATGWAATGQLSVFELQAITGHRTTKMLTRYINLKVVDIAQKMADVCGDKA